MDTDDEADILIELARQCPEEADVAAVLAVIQAARRKTWSENKKIKKGHKTDRQRNMRDGGSFGAGQQSGAFRPKRKRLTISQLKLVTKCGNCGETGHWHKQCPNPYKPKRGLGFLLFLGI